MNINYWLMFFYFRRVGTSRAWQCPTTELLIVFIYGYVFMSVSEHHMFRMDVRRGCQILWSSITGGVSEPPDMGTGTWTQILWKPVLLLNCWANSSALFSWMWWKWLWVSQGEIPSLCISSSSRRKPRLFYWSVCQWVVCRPQVSGGYRQAFCI